MNKIFRFGLVLTAAVSLAGCNIDFDGIGKDDDGNDITLIMLDLPQSDVNYTFTVVDARTGFPLNSEFTATVTPDTANDGGLANPDQMLVTDAMRVSATHTFTESFELQLNPTIAVSDANPVGFTIVADRTGYVGIPAYVRSTEKGRREIVLEVIDLSNPPLSLMPSPVLSPMPTAGVADVTTSGVPTTRLAVLNRSLGNGFVVQSLHQVVSSGTLTVTTTTPLAYDGYGVIKMTDNLNGAPRASLVVTAGQYIYIVKRYANIVPGKLAFDVNADFRAAGSFRYKVVTSVGTYSGVFRNMIPFSKQFIEQLYVYSTDKAATLTVVPLADVNLVGDSVRRLTDITGANGGMASPAYQVTKKVGRTNYKIKLIATCATDKKISLAPSKAFVYRKVGTTTWLRGEFKAGNTSLLLETGQEYEFGVNFNGKSYQYPFTTTRANIENVLRNQYIDKYTLTETADGFSISITVVAAEICDLTS